VASLSANPPDLVYSGDPNPRIVGSFRNTIGWKNFALSFNILYKLGYYSRRNSIDYSSQVLVDFATVVHSDYGKRWQKPGDEIFTNVPSLPATSDFERDRIYKYADILIEPADHIRLQDIRLSYDINSFSTGKLNVKDVLVYLYAGNLGILWRKNKSGIDPENGNSVLRSPKRFSIGCNLKF
jgi:hypothetical protein